VITSDGFRWIQKKSAHGEGLEFMKDRENR
jgi:hypothetical protein